MCPNFLSNFTVLESMYTIYMHIYVYICFNFRNTTEDLKQKSAKMCILGICVIMPIKFEMLFK